MLTCLANLEEKKEAFSVGSKEDAKKILKETLADI